MLDVVKTDKMAILYGTLLLAMSLGHDLYRVVAHYCFLPGALRGGGVRASDWLSKGRRFESRLRRFFTPTPAESLPFLTPPLAETVN